MAIRHSYKNYLSKYRISQTWAQHLKNGSAGGVDFAVPIGTPIQAPAKCRIENTPSSGTGGNFVTAWHETPGLGLGYRDQFLHLSRFVKPGHYKQGDIIGYSGNSGKSTGPHIHWHLITPKGVRVNPYNYFTKTLTGLLKTLTPTKKAK